MHFLVFISDMLVVNKNNTKTKGLFCNMLRSAMIMCSYVKLNLCSSTHDYKYSENNTIVNKAMQSTNQILANNKKVLSEYKNIEHMLNQRSDFIKKNYEKDIICKDYSLRYKLVINKADGQKNTPFNFIFKTRMTPKKNIDSFNNNFSINQKIKEVLAKIVKPLSAEFFEILKICEISDISKLYQYNFDLAYSENEKFLEFSFLFLILEDSTIKENELANYIKEVKLNMALKTGNTYLNNIFCKSKQFFSKILRQNDEKIPSSEENLYTKMITCSKENILDLEESFNKDIARFIKNCKYRKFFFHDIQKLKGKNHCMETKIKSKSVRNIYCKNELSNSYLNEKFQRPNEEKNNTLTRDNENAIIQKDIGKRNSEKSIINSIENTTTSNLQNIPSINDSCKATNEKTIDGTEKRNILYQKKNSKKLNEKFKTNEINESENILACVDNDEITGSLECQVKLDNLEFKNEKICIGNEVTSESPNLEIKSNRVTFENNEEKKKTLIEDTIESKKDSHFFKIPGFVITNSYDEDDDEFTDSLEYEAKSVQKIDEKEKICMKNEKENISSLDNYNNRNEDKNENKCNEEKNKSENNQVKKLMTIFEINPNNLNSELYKNDIRPQLLDKNLLNDQTQEYYKSAIDENKFMKKSIIVDFDKFKDDTCTHTASQKVNDEKPNDETSPYSIKINSEKGLKENNTIDFQENLGDAKQNESKTNVKKRIIPGINENKHDGNEIVLAGDNILKNPGELTYNKERTNRESLLSENSSIGYFSRSSSPLGGKNDHFKGSNEDMNNINSSSSDQEIIANEYKIKNGFKKDSKSKTFSYYINLSKEDEILEIEKKRAIKNKQLENNLNKYKKSNPDTKIDNSKIKKGKKVFKSYNERQKQLKNNDYNQKLATNSKQIPIKIPSKGFKENKIVVRNIGNTNGSKNVEKLIDLNNNGYKNPYVKSDYNFEFKKDKVENLNDKFIDMERVNNLDEEILSKNIERTARWIEQNIHRYDNTKSYLNQKKFQDLRSLKTKEANNLTDILNYRHDLTKTNKSLGLKNIIKYNQKEDDAISTKYGSNAYKKSDNRENITRKYLLCKYSNNLTDTKNSCKSKINMQNINNSKKIKGTQFGQGFGLPTQRLIVKKKVENFTVEQKKQFTEKMLKARNERIRARNQKDLCNILKGSGPIVIKNFLKYYKNEDKKGFERKCCESVKYYLIPGLKNYQQPTFSKIQKENATISYIYQ